MGTENPVHFAGVNIIEIFQDLGSHLRLITGRNQETPQIKSQGGSNKEAG